MANPEMYPRLVEPRIDEALVDTPVVLIHGPRQCGNTTLAQMVGKARGYASFSFDDCMVLAAAQADPVGFVGDLPERIILDEVKRAPEIFTSLKTADHRHIGESELPYKFSTPRQLVNDFMCDVRRWRNENGDP